MSERKRIEQPATVNEPELEGSELLQAMLVVPALLDGQRLDGLMIGRLTGFSGEGAPLVEHAAHAGVLVARMMAALAPADVGREVVLGFEAGDPHRPIVMGLLVAPAARGASADGERLVLEAQREIVLRCGKSSITLTREGKVILRGAYLLSRASGTNRIQGGNVSIN